LVAGKAICRKGPEWQMYREEKKRGGVVAITKREQDTVGWIYVTFSRISDKKRLHSGVVLTQRPGCRGGDPDYDSVSFPHATTTREN